MSHVKSSPFSSIQNLIKFAKQFDYLPLFSKHNVEYIFLNFFKKHFHKFKTSKVLYVKHIICFLCQVFTDMTST